VINGDVLDRGPENKAALEMVWRLMEEAPAGRVHYNIGNHEMPIFVPEVLNWPGTYSSKMVETSRESFLRRVVDGDVTAAFEGYNYVYSHAGSNESFDPATINNRLREAAERLLENTDTPSNPSFQQRIVDEYDRIFELGEAGGRGPSAGLCWMDFRHMAESSPPQIVGHSMQNTPTRKGNVICGNVIRRNQVSEGGEGVLIETPEEVEFVYRTVDGSASVSGI